MTLGSDLILQDFCMKFEIFNDRDMCVCSNNTAAYHAL